LKCLHNSVLDAFELTSKRSAKKFVSITCANEGKEYVDLEVFLRAGMRSQIDKLCEKKTIDIPNAKFRINMNLRLATSSPQNYGEQNIDTITEMNDDKKDIDGKGIGLGLFEEQKTWPSRSKTKPTLKLETEEGALLLRSNTDPERSGEMEKEPSPYNTFIEVNVLHLSIIAKQVPSIQWIMDHISKERERFSENLSMLLDDRVFLANVKQFSRKDQSLDGMNALHLSSQYCPEAMEIIFETIYMYDFLPINLPKIVQDNNTFLKLTPLHIAARKSSLKAAR
jgi:hypothetical protein